MGLKAEISRTGMGHFVIIAEHCVEETKDDEFVRQDFDSALTQAIIYYKDIARYSRWWSYLWPPHYKQRRLAEGRLDGLLCYIGNSGVSANLTRIQAEVCTTCGGS